MHSTARATEAGAKRVIAVFGIKRSSDEETNVFYTDAAFVRQQLENTIPEWDDDDTSYISGGANGVELITETWAKENNLRFERIKPQTETQPIHPFDVRNEKIIRKSTEVVLFWDAIDNFVARALREAVKQGRKVTIIPVKS